MSGDIVIKIVRPGMPRNALGAVDFDESDAEDWAKYAIKGHAWRQTCVQGAPRLHSDVIECVVAISSPDGRIAVWYGLASVVAPTGNRGFRRFEPTSHAAAYAACGDAGVAALFDSSRTRGGDRDVTQLANAACRVLHAQAFGYEPTERDRFLAEFAALEGADRPSTKQLIRASTDALAAASALLAIKNYVGVQMLLAGKGVYAV